MTTRSAVLIPAQLLPTAGPFPSYTCPVGRRTIVKDLLVFNGNAATQSVFVQVDTGGGAVSVLREILATGTSTRRELWLVLEAGDTISLVPTAVTVAAALSGAELVE